LGFSFELPDVVRYRVTTEAGERSARKKLPFTTSTRPTKPFSLIFCCIELHRLALRSKPTAFLTPKSSTAVNRMRPSPQPRS